MESAAVKYKPLKGKKLNDFIFNGTKLEPQLQKHIEENNKDNILVVNIESVPAMEALDEILDVPGLDAVFIGPHDLTYSLGIPEQYGDPKYESAVEEIITKAIAKNVGAGIHMCYPDNRGQEIKWIKGGANFIVHSADIKLLQSVMRDQFDNIKKAVSDDISAENVSIDI